MEKKDNLHYFESYEEINDYLSQNLPGEVFMTKVFTAILRDGLVVAEAKRMRRAAIYDDVSRPGDKADIKIIGSVTDFPATDFATIHERKPVEIHADSMLEGLYRAGDHLASKMQKDDKEAREMFVAKDFVTPTQKGGAIVKYPGNTSYIYRILTKTGKYDVAALSLFDVIDRAEKAEEVKPAKRHRFTVGQSDNDTPLLARIWFDMDKMVPKMKACWTDDEIRAVMMQPAIDLKRGIMVATNGRILAMHKLSGFSVETCDEAAIREIIHDTSDGVCISVPRGVVSMTGRVRIDVTAATCEDDRSETVDCISVKAVDSQFAAAEMKQHFHYPKYSAVVWRKQGAVVPIDERLLKSVKMVASGLTKKDPLYEKIVIIDSPRGYDTIQLTRKVRYEGKTVQQVAPLPGTSCGILSCACSDFLLAALAFCPTSVCFYGPASQIVFMSESTWVLVMPMRMEDEDYRPLGNTDRRDGCYFDAGAFATLPDNNFDKWLDGVSDATDTEKPVPVKVKVRKPQPVVTPTVQHTGPSLSEVLRRRLRAAMGIAV